MEYALPDVLTQYAFVGALMFLVTLIISVGATFIVCGAVAGAVAGKERRRAMKRLLIVAGLLVASAAQAQSVDRQVQAAINQAGHACQQVTHLEGAGTVEGGDWLLCAVCSDGGRWVCCGCASEAGKRAVGASYGAATGM